MDARGPQIAQPAMVVPSVFFRMDVVDMSQYQAAALCADRIEQELKAIHAWSENALPEEAYNFERAFAADTMSFYQWIQFILLDRIRSIVAEEGEFPARSQVSTYAVRELDGVNEASGLIDALNQLDDLINSARR
jgi:uncharacterized protein YqcC (DUF446 family)